jgi:hypothetical protein
VSRRGERGEIAHGRGRDATARDLSRDSVAQFRQPLTGERQVEPTQHTVASSSTST